MSDVYYLGRDYMPPDYFPAWFWGETIQLSKVHNVGRSIVTLLVTEAAPGRYASQVGEDATILYILPGDQVEVESERISPAQLQNLIKIRAIAPVIVREEEP